MVAGLDDLVTLVRPPADVHVEVEWAAVEGNLGTRLPADYKGLVQTYGPGAFDDFLSVFQPVTPFLTLELAYQARRGAEIHGRDELMAVAGTDNGDTLYWVKHPADEPDAWTITGNGARNDQWPRFDGGLAAFLHAVLSGALRFPIFPNGFPRQSPVFTPQGIPDPRRLAKLRAQGLYRDQ
jgi:hypothetical protein